jgi:hypothetical protein
VVKARGAEPKSSDLAQVAALPIAVGDDGVLRLLLLTSRETKRLIMPKGWNCRFSDAILALPSLAPHRQNQNQGCEPDDRSDLFAALAEDEGRDHRKQHRQKPI